MYNLAEATWTVDELRAFGIEAKLAPLPPRILANQPQPLPSPFTVLFYLPKTRGEFYGRREYERLMRTFAGRNVRFYVVGGGECYAPPAANVTHLGWLTSLRPCVRGYLRARALYGARWTLVDDARGLGARTARAVDEGFPYVRQVRTYDEMQCELSALLDAHERGELQPQHEAARYIAQAYSPESCLETIASTWDEAVRYPSRREIASAPS